jgi:hypothetical protein
MALKIFQARLLEIWELFCPALRQEDSTINYIRGLRQTLRMIEYKNTYKVYVWLKNSIDFRF